jgi:hypothetical protein
VSELAAAEVASSLSRLVRMGVLDPNDASLRLADLLVTMDRRFAAAAEALGVSTKLLTAP